MKILVTNLSVALVILGLLGAKWYSATSTGAADLDNLVMNQRFFSSEQVAENLSSSDRHLAISSLSILAKRESGLGTDTAKSWLSSEHDWLHGARYLGERGDPVAIPYLIRGLDHPYASGLYESISEILEDLTGQKLGQNKQSWIQWWESTNPSSDFNFSTEFSIIPPRYRSPQEAEKKKQNKPEMATPRKSPD